MAADRVILGEKCIYSTDSNETGINNNVVVCGGSGSGKTVSVSEPRLLETHNSSIVATVTKRRIVHKYTELFRQRGYEVMDLNFVSPSDSNICYDPMAYVNSYTDITFLARSIVMSNARKDRSNADPYWDDSAISLLSAEIAYVKMANKQGTFADVLDMHDSLTIESGSDLIKTSLDNKFKALAAKYPDCFAVNCWKTFKQLPVRTASCVFSALNTTIDSIFTPDLRKMIREKSRIDFSQFANRRTALFISTSAVNPALNCFINIFYAQMFKQLFEYAESQPDGVLPEGAKRSFIEFTGNSIKIGGSSMFAVLLISGCVVLVVLVVILLVATRRARFEKKLRMAAERQRRRTGGTHPASKQVRPAPRPKKEKTPAERS